MASTPQRAVGRAMATDRLSLANALEAANIDRPAGERIATEIYDAIHNNVATKSDLPLAGARGRGSEARRRIAKGSAPTRIGYPSGEALAAGPSGGSLRDRTWRSRKLAPDEVDRSIMDTQK